MSTPAPLKDILQWDVKNWSEVLHYWDAEVQWEGVHHCLELGGREGGLSIWLALKGKTVVCSDLRDVMRSAQPNHKKHNIDSLITYREIDATAIPYENHFDLVVFKSVLGGVGKNGNKGLQKKMLDEIHKALRPGGKLLFAENLAASPLHQFLRKQFTGWGNSWRYVSIGEIEEFLVPYSSYRMRTTGVLGTFGRNEAQRTLLATVDQALLNKICPPRWNYIAYGVAVK